MVINLIPVDQFIRCLVRAILKHNIGALAAVIAFFGLSAMIPLAILLIYGASVFIPNTLIKYGILIIAGHLLSNTWWGLVCSEYYCL